MPENTIIGDNFGTDLPKTQVDETLLNNEKKLARYSKTKEYQALKQYLEDRIEFYKTFLPNGDDVRFEASPEAGIKWTIANNIINEFRTIINRYEQAREIVKNAAGGN